MFFLEYRADSSDDQILLVRPLLTDLNTANRKLFHGHVFPIGAKTRSMASSAERSFDAIKNQNSLAEQK